MSEEPAFVRLLFEAISPARPLWIANYTMTASTLVISTTHCRADAKIFLSPPPEEIAALSRRSFAVTLVPATYAEWIEQDPKKETKS